MYIAFVLEIDPVSEAIEASTLALYILLVINPGTMNFRAHCMRTSSIVIDNNIVWRVL